MRRRWMAALFGSILAGCTHLPNTVASPERYIARSAAHQSTAADLPPDLGAGSGPSAEREREDFVDLFQRMRAGFAFPRVEALSVRREIAWYQEHSGFLDRSFRRGRRYLHHIVETLEERNMPRELALLPVVESAFDPFARSRCLALGLWQFIPETGRRYGLEQDGWRDDRRDVLDATRAALDHLADLHEEFAGDWLLALAAYNAGDVTVRRAGEPNQRLGRPIDFFALDLPEETRGYGPKLPAIARLVDEPAAHGIQLP